MFKTAGVGSIWWFFSVLSVVSIVMLLGACAHSPTAGSGEPENWVVENVASKSTPELYAQWIRPGIFEGTGSKIVNGYTVESGKLRMPDSSDGSLVTVRSADGGLTAFISKPGGSGSLYVNSQGASQFIPVSVTDNDIDDAVPNPSEKVATAPVKSNSTETYIIDLFMGYSKAGVVRAGGDAMRDALAKVEFFNLVLRNSRVDNVSFKLVGVQVVEQDYQVTRENLGKLGTIFSEGIAKSEPDYYIGNFGSFEPAGAFGYAYMPGRSAIVISHEFSGASHEIGHGAGIDHCNYSEVNNYRFGYFNGKSGSLLCGVNTQAYYSNPNLKDEHGLPRGNAVTADGARVWRENAQRLSSYTNFQPKAPADFQWISSSRYFLLFNWRFSPRAVKYEVWREGEMIGETESLSFTAATNQSALQRYHVVGVFADGTKSPISNYVWAKPL